MTHPAADVTATSVAAAMPRPPPRRHALFDRYRQGYSARALAAPRADQAVAELFAEGSKP